MSTKFEIGNLYKKYRPKVWEKFYGQKSAVETIRRDILSGKLKSAYLFTGPPGCGKTSAALTLAKAINCLDSPGDGNPCNACEVCLAIDNRTQQGVYLRDMANNGGVDDVRGIVEKANLKQPIAVPVEILDEAHNLGVKGFDTLLNPIGETGLQTIFIFCSTEPEKFKPAILSRLTHIRFERVGSEPMTELVESVLADENRVLPDDSIAPIVRSGGGSPRNTLNILERVLDGASIDAMPVTYGRKILVALGKRNITAMLVAIQEAVDEGIDPKDLLVQLIEDLRTVLLISSKYPNPPEVPLSSVPKFIEAMGGLNSVLHVMGVLGEAYGRIVRGEDSRLNTELGMIESIRLIHTIRQSA